MSNTLRTLTIAAVAAVAGTASAWIINPDTAGGRFVIQDQATNVNNWIGGDADDSAIVRGAIVAPLFFWGETYTNVIVSSNGHINWQRKDGKELTYDNQENTWRVYSQTHAAALPRICFLGEDLNQSNFSGQPTSYIENDTADFYAVTYKNVKSFSREGNNEFHSGQVIIFRQNTTITNEFGSFDFQARDIAMAYESVDARRTGASGSDPEGKSFRRTTSGTGAGIPVERGQTGSVVLFKGDPTFEEDPFFFTFTPVDFGTLVAIPNAPVDGLDTNAQTPDGTRRYPGQLIYGARMLNDGTVVDPATDERSVIPGYNGKENRFVLYRWDAANQTYIASIESFTGGSVSEEVFPSSLNRLRGRIDAGDVSSVQGDDTTFLRVCRFIVPNDPNRVFEIDYNGTTTVPNATSFKLDVRSRATVGGLIQQTLQVFNYQTNAFDATDFSQVNVNTTFTTRTVTGTGTVARLIGTNGALRARQTFRIVGPVPNPNFCKETSLVRWTIGN